MRSRGRCFQHRRSPVGSGGKRLFEGRSVEDTVTKLVGGKDRPSPLVEAPWSGELSRSSCARSRSIWRSLRERRCDGSRHRDHRRRASGQDVKARAVRHRARRDARFTLRRSHDAADVGASLSPFANSIPANGEGAHGGLRFDARAASARRSRAAHSAAAPDSFAGMPMAARRRFTIVGSALGFCALVLAIAGLKSIDRRRCRPRPRRSDTGVDPVDSDVGLGRDLDRSRAEGKPERHRLFRRPKARPAATAKAESGRRQIVASGIVGAGRRAGTHPRTRDEIGANASENRVFRKGK